MNKIFPLFILLSLLWLTGCPNDDNETAGLKRAQELFKSSDYEEALAMYEDLIEAEGSVARVGAGWCYLKLNDHATANTYFSLSADDSLTDGYAGWTFTSWAVNNPQGAIEKADFVLRKNTNYTFSLDPRITADHLIWIQASGYFQLGNYAGSVDRIKILDIAFDPDLNAPDISQLIAEKLQIMGAVHF